MYKPAIPHGLWVYIQIKYMHIKKINSKSKSSPGYELGKDMNLVDRQVTKSCEALRATQRGLLEELIMYPQSPT